MQKKSKERTGTHSLADDLREGLEEMRRFARGEETGVIIHRVIPSRAKARRAAKLLGLAGRKPKPASPRTKAKTAR